MSIEKEKEKGVHRPEGSAVTKPLRLQFIQEMATANWNKLYDRYYRKREVYKMQWDDIDLSRHICAGAPFGGPVAIVRNEKLARSDDREKPKLRIFTSAGRRITSIAWEYRGLVSLGWTNAQQLCAVLEDGTVMLFTIAGELVDTFYMGREDGVAEAHIWGSGLVVRTIGKSQLFAIVDWVDHRVRKLADPQLQSPPVSMSVIPPDVSLSHGVEVVLATAQGSIIVCDEAKAQDQRLTSGPFVKMCVSPTGLLIACFSANGLMRVLSTDFTKNLSEFDSGSRKAPLDLVWCGEDSVVLYWESLLLMVGPYGDFVKYSYDSAVALIPECDGVRVLSNEQCEFLSRVPSSTEDIFRIGSFSPPALLFDALEAFESEDAKADENIRSIREKESLDQAIEACIDAAAHEFDTFTQRKLLRAAAFGKLYLDEYSPDAYVDMCRTLRVLNQVRDPEVGMPLSYTQFMKLSPEVLIDRLTNVHHHHLASRICQYLRIPQDKVLVHWACTKIRSIGAEDLTDEALAAAIHSKLSAVPRISYAQAAQTANSLGRPDLTTMLLDYEPRASDQVPLLLKMGREEIALKKAVESGDSDLVFLVILHLHRTRTEVEMFKLITGHALAANLFVVYCKQQRDLQLLKSFYYHLQRPDEAANVVALEAYQSSRFDERITELELALEFYQKDKNSSFSAQAVDNQIQLLKLQRDRELELHEQFVDVSCSQMLATFVAAGQSKVAQKIAANFKIPDTRLWHVQIKTLSACHRWDELEALLPRDNSSPIGILPFVQACVEEKALIEAAKYIKRLDDVAEKMQWFCNIGFWREAAEVAAQNKDVDALQTIRSQCKNPAVVSWIDSVLKGARAT